MLFEVVIHRRIERNRHCSRLNGGRSEGNGNLWGTELTVSKECAETYVFRIQAFCPVFFFQHDLGRNFGLRYVGVIHDEVHPLIHVVQLLV